MRVGDVAYTRSMRAAVVYRLIVWPSVRAEAEATPSSSPITRAGQHHAPIRAGMLRARTRNETRRPLRSVRSSSEASGLSGASSSCSFRLLCAAVEVQPSAAGCCGGGSAEARGLGR